MKRVPGKQRKETVDPWKSVFPLEVLDRFQAQAYHPLSVEFMDVLRHDRENGPATLGLGLCYAAMNKIDKAAALLLKVKKQVPLHEAITRFLPSHYKIWMDLTEQFLARREFELATKLRDELTAAWRPSKGKLLTRYNRIIKSVDWLQQNKGIASRLWWYLTMAPSNMISLVLFIAIGIAVLTTGAFMGKRQIAGVFMERAKANYMRGILSIIHIEQSRPVPDASKLAKMTRKQRVETLYPGDRTVPAGYFNGSLKELQDVGRLDPGNFDAEFLELRCYDMLHRLEINEAEAKKLEDKIQKLKTKLLATPGGDLRMSTLQKEYDNNKRSLQSGELKNL